MIRLFVHPDSALRFNGFGQQLAETAPEGFFYPEYEDTSSFLITEDNDPLGLEAHHIEGDIVYLHFLFADDVSYEKRIHTISHILQLLIRKNHPLRFISETEDVITRRALSSNLFYPKGRKMMRIQEKWRYVLDDRVFDEEGYIIDQGKMKDIPFGWFNTKDKGCGWIAAYNLLKMNGLEKEMQEVAEDLQKYAMLGEVGGQSFITLGMYLKKCGLPVHFRPVMKATASYLMKTSHSGILMYTHRRGGHYVAWRNIGEGRVHFYNAIYGSRMHETDPESFITKHVLLPSMYLFYIA